MSYFRAGDLVFRQTGQPAVFTGEKAAEGKIVLDSGKQALKEGVRHGYINGLSPQERDQFNVIMDEVKAIEEPEKRMEELQAKVQMLKEDPKKNYNVARYLNAEISHIMNTAGLKPRFFAVDEFKVK